MPSGTAVRIARALRPRAPLPRPSPPARHRPAGRRASSRSPRPGRAVRRPAGPAVGQSRGSGSHAMQPEDARPRHRPGPSGDRQAIPTPARHESVARSARPQAAGTPRAGTARRPQRARAARTAPASSPDDRVTNRCKPSSAGEPGRASCAPFGPVAASGAQPGTLQRVEESGPVLRERADDIEIVRLNRPGKRNALDTATLAALTATLDELAADTTLRVLVLSTSSVAAFCAGADVTERLDHEAGVARMAAFARLYTQLDEFPAPVISVLVGNCVGAGAEIIAATDLRVGGDNLRLAWAGARLGVPVGPARLVPLIGVARAKDLILTGRAVGSAEARELGLLQH